MINKVKNFLYEELTYQIRGSVFEIYKTLGNGHKEKVYQGALIKEFTNKKIQFNKEKRIDVFYKGEKVGVYVPDIVVENKVIIELKAKPFISKEDTNQFWQYLRGTEYKLGLLINFGSFPRVQIIRRAH